MEGGTWEEVKGMAVDGWIGGLAFSAWYLWERAQVNLPKNKLGQHL